MAQEREAMAFRKRLKSAGYRDIRISLSRIPLNVRRGQPETYDVSAVEPLSGQRVFVTLTTWEMRGAFQRRRGTLTSVVESKAGIPASASPASGMGIPSSA